jgi:UDP-galactopyranose mutase
MEAHDAAEQAAGISGTLITREHPYTPRDSNHYEYPFPDERNHELYAAYRSRVAASDRLMICGRLGEYRYFDMDQAIGRALKIARKILHSRTLQPRRFIAPPRTPACLLLAAGKMLIDTNGPSYG